MIRCIGIAAIAIALAFGVGRYQGKAAGVAQERAAAAAARADLQARIWEQGAQIAGMARELERQREMANDRAMEFEDAARADPDNDRPGIGPDGLRRLEGRWNRGSP